MTYLWAVPACNTHVATDAGKPSNRTLVLPTVLRDETILTVRAGYGCERAAAIIVTSVI
jgi:hypothetical protein